MNKTNVTNSIRSNWRPDWLVDIGHDCQCGITFDDHCYVALSQGWDDKWKPTKHIPPIVAKFLCELANTPRMISYKGWYDWQANPFPLPI